MPARLLAIGVAISLAACGLNQTQPASPTPSTVTPMALSPSPSASQPSASAVPSASVPPSSPRPSIQPVVPVRSIPSYNNHGSRTRKWIALTFDAVVERLTVTLIAVSMALEKALALLRKRDRLLAVAGHPYGFREALLAKVAKVT